MSNRDELLVEVFRLAGEDKAADLAARVLARADEPQGPAEPNASPAVEAGARSPREAAEAARQAEGKWLLERLKQDLPDTFGSRS